MTVLTGMSAPQAAALWSGLLILFLVVLSIRVVLARRTHRVLLGDGGVSQVTVAGRVFGNAAEYVPTGIGALALLAMLGMPSFAIHTVGAVLFVGRVIHAVGLSDRKPTPGRMAGMVLTYLALLSVGAMLVVHAFV